MSSSSLRPVLFFLEETPPLSAQTLPLTMSQRCGELLPLTMSQRCGELLKLFLSMFSPGLSCWSSASLHQLLPITLLLTTDKVVTPSQMMVSMHVM